MDNLCFVNAEKMEKLRHGGNWLCAHNPVRHIYGCYGGHARSPAHGKDSRFKDTQILFFRILEY